MRKINAILITTITFSLNFGACSFAEGILWQNISQEENSLKTVLIDSDNPLLIYFGSNNGIFKSEDGGENWRNVFPLNGQNKTINHIVFDPADKNRLYTAGTDGLFYSSDKGKSWNRLFKAETNSECTVLSVLPYGIYLGTEKGIFISKDHGLSWQKEKGELGRSHIIAIAYDHEEPGHLYAATNQEIFLSADRGETWKSIFKASSPADEPDEENETAEQTEEAEGSFQIRHIAIDHNPHYIYAATSRGAYISQDKGQSWQTLSASGLPYRDIAFILISPASGLDAVIKSGIFEYKNGYWRESSIGLSAGQIHCLAKDNKGTLYAASDKGLFKTKTRNSLSIADFTAEPGIRQVQKAAIEYAEVDPTKIISWRKQAARKALLPQVSVGIDRDTSELWHWEGGSTTRTDDDILRRGRDTVDWDMTLSWDLGDLIWNNDQTYIDVRSRLLVQLRNDILDEVTRTYFERLRLKKEIEKLEPDDQGKIEEKKLRLEELTANLDALTGGYFSRNTRLTADTDKRYAPS